MRIGLPGLDNSVERVIRQAERAEADGFSALWFTSGTLGDPLLAMAIAARATATLEVGTAILQSYTCHPVLLAARAIATTEAIGAPGRFTLGVGPSHQVFVEDMLGIPYDNPGRHTEEYVQVLAPLLRGEAVRFEGHDYRTTAGPFPLPPAGETPLMIAALGPRLLRVAGQHTSGTITWMANARAIGEHISPRIRSAAADAGRTAPRIVAGLPLAVHDDPDEAREVAASSFGFYATLPNYQRIFERGAIPGPAEAAIVGDEAAVAAQLQELLDAGATEVWAAPFPVGDDRQASRARTRALLKSLT